MERLAISPVGAELLDDPTADPVAVTETLRNIARSNRWFGGTAAVLYGCRRLLAGVAPGTTLSLLDLGTGAGDLPRAAMRWAVRRGIRLEPVGLERSRVAAGVASAAGIPCAVGCAGAPPVREKGVDLVLVSQVLHHLAPPSVVRLLATCDRLARRGVVVADLRRGRLGPLVFWVGARALRFDPMTRADGMTSIRRGYTPEELRRLLAAAGIEATIDRRPGYRLVASWRTSSA
jgi:SAM-dependent methyltransferase